MQIDASHFNLPKTENAMVNGRGHRLHFRIFHPILEGRQVEQNASQGICFWVHGFGGHSNRPEIQNLAKYFNPRGYYVLSLGKMCFQSSSRFIFS
jgi:alpha-beta hydrolase superfamily lysophospholipase